MAEDYEVTLKPEKWPRHIPETPFRTFSEQERAELYRRVHGDKPAGDSDSEETVDVDFGTLDFNRPFPGSLNEPEEFSGKLHDFADESLSRLQLEATFLEFLPIRGQASEEAQKQLDEFLYSFLADLRLAQGKTALFQPLNQVTEYRKYRAIVPAAPALLRLNDWAAGMQRAVSDGVWPDLSPRGEWPDISSIGQGPMEFTATDGSVVKVPQNFPQVVRADGSAGRMSYGLALKLELHSLQQASSRLRDIFGAPDAWVKKAEYATLESIFRSLRTREIDHEEFLVHLQQLLGVRVDDVQFRGELARAIFPLSLLKNSEPEWRAKDHPFRYLARRARRAVDKRFFRESNSWTLPGDGGPRMPAIEGERISGIPESLREQAIRWLEREGVRLSARSGKKEGPRWIYVEDFASADISQGDAWDRWSEDLSRGCRQNGASMGAYFGYRDSISEFPWEFIGQRYLQERDAETLRKRMECKPGEAKTRVVSHSDYMHLRRALAKLPDRWDLRELQEYLESVAAKKLAEFAAQQEVALMPVSDNDNPSMPRVVRNLFDGDPGSWVWAWDETHLRNFSRGNALELGDADESGNMVSGAEQGGRSPKDDPKQRTDTPVDHTAVVPSARFTVKRDPAQPWSNENSRPVR
jgi:hypothetical protein